MQTIANALTNPFHFSRISAIAFCLAIVSSTVFATSGPLAITKDTKLKADHVGVITIAASGVTLNCNGYQVSAPGEFAAIVVSNQSDITIKNCVVTGAEYGISVEVAADIVIKDNIASGNNVLGMYINTVVGDLTIKNNDASDNGSTGFYIANATNSTIKDNTASNNATFGYTIYYLTESLVKDNIAVENGPFGFLLYSSAGNVLKNNAACGHQADLLLDTIVPGANEFKKNQFCTTETQ